MQFERPASLDEALELLAQKPWRVLAGGTDFYPALAGRPGREDVLDINGLAALRGISDDGEWLRIGARTTWSDVIRADLPPALEALQLAAREVGSIQIQNTGTVAGNLCNASPAADGVPPLLAVDAEVELASRRGRRHLKLAEFLQGNRQTARAADELMTAIRLPNERFTGASHFLKLGARRYLVISIAMVAARVVADGDGRITEAAVAVGACSAVAQRLTGLETALAGCRTPAGIADAVAGADLLELTPIDDVRATAAYRRTAAREVVTRTLHAAFAAATARTEIAA